MKQTLKKVMSFAFLLIFVFALTACGSAKQEEPGIDEALSQNMTMTAESLSEAIVVLTQDQIDAYKESGDAFTEMAMEAWEGSKDELGEYESMGEAVAEEISDGYSVTVPMTFSVRNAELVYSFDDQGTPTGLAVNPEYTFGEKMQQAGMNTLMGVGIVFIILIFLSFLISLFRFIPELEVKLEKKKAGVPVEEKKEPAAQPVVETAAEELVDDGELVAVIAAAIAASEGTSTDAFVVRSIKKVSRKRW